MNKDRRRGRDTLTNEDATYGWRKSFRYVAKRQNGVQTAGANPARSIEMNNLIMQASCSDISLPADIPNITL